MIQNEAAWEAGRKRNILCNAQKTWRANTERSEEIERWLAMNHEGSKFARSLYSSLTIQYGKLTEGQCAAVLKIIDGDIARRAKRAADRREEEAASNPVGELKERLELLVCVTAAFTYEKQQFSYYDSTVGYGYVFTTADGNILKLFTGSPIDAEKGDKIKIRGTVKKHDGNITIINRVKIH